MSEQNNVPTAPGWYWARIHPSNEPEVLYVRGDGNCSGIGFGAMMTVTREGIEWLGPAPPPGTWAPRELFDHMRHMLYMINPAPGTPADNVLQAAQEWAAQNPAPEVTR